MRNKGLLIVIAVALIIGIFFLVTYNSLVTKEENVKRYWGDLNSTYQRRTDLIPGLVAVVKGASEYEKNVLEQTTAARAKASQVVLSGNATFQDYQQLEQAQGEVANAVNRTLAVVENYPDLKATKNFLFLQSQLEGTERRIKVARKDFNAAVADYNQSVRRAPKSFIAGILGFRPKEGFTADAGADNAPEVIFKK